MEGFFLVLALYAPDCVLAVGVPSCVAVALLGQRIEAFVSLQLTSLRGWTSLFLDESCSVMEKWLFPALAGNNERDLLALSDHHLLRSG